MALSADGVVEGVSLLMGCDDAIHASRMGSEQRAMRGCRPVVGVPSAIPGLKSRGSTRKMWRKPARPPRLERGTPGLEGPSSDS